MGMNKGKLKREMKELQRLFTQGSHGEFLRRVEREGVAAAFPKETAEAWQSLLRAAWANPEGMTAFFLQRCRLTSTPDLPDLRILDQVEQFLKGAPVSLEGMPLHKLSPPAQLMARRLLQWDNTQVTTEEIEALFTRFVTTPQEITGQEMGAAARFFPKQFARGLTVVSRSLETLRRFNGRDCAEKLRDNEFETVAQLDQEVEESVKGVPEGIVNIFLAPLLRQLARLYERQCEVDSSLSLELADAAPFLSSHLAGDRWEEVEELLCGDDLSQRCTEDPRYLRKRIAFSGFPEKVRLLRSVEMTLSRVMTEYDDPERWDDTAGQSLIRTLRADYLFLYLDVLTQLGRDRAKLSGEEQRELAQVMGELLDRAFVTFVSDPLQCDEFLQGVAQAGLLDTKQALTSLLIARTTGNRTLREAAEQALIWLPPPEKGDIHWIFKFFGFLSYPTVSALSPVIGQIEPHESLLVLLADLIAIQVTRALVENQMVKFSRLGIFQALKKGECRNIREEMAKFRSELMTYKEITAFDHLFILAESYPEGYITETGFRKVLTDRYDRRGIEEIIRRMKQLPSPPPGMTEMDPQHSALFGMELRESLEFVKQHFNDLGGVPLESLVELVEILERSGSRIVGTEFLLTLTALFQQRRETGEAEFAALGSRIAALIPVTAENQG